MANKMSAKLTLFVLSLKNSTIERGITFDDFITEIRPINKGRISRYQFLKVIERFNSQGSSFDAMELFKELSKQEDSIPITTLKQHYVRLARLSNQRVGSEQVKQKQYQEQLEQVEKKKKMAKAGFEALFKYIKTHPKEPSIIFDDCDQDRSGDIDQAELNKFLIASEIEEFKDKAVRKQLIEDIFARFSSNKIKKENFFSLFQVQAKKPATNNKKRVLNPEQSTTNLQARQKPRNIRINIKKRQQPQLNPQQQLKPKTASVIVSNPSEIPTTPQVIKQNTTKANSKDFPLAKMYYRHGTPPSSDLIYLQELQSLLASKKVFVDKSNPQSSGTYTQASKLLNEHYQLFSQSPSELNRTRGHNEIAQFIEAKDIKQGSIGDCYFMSAISSLASMYPELLSERFLFNINPAQYSCVKLFVDGQWKYVPTDDRFASNNGQILYAKPNQNEIWVMLLQKAFAKVYGSYTAIESGNMSESFFLLTGAPQQILTLKKGEKQAIIRQIFEATKKGYILGTSGNQYLSSLGKSAESQFGLVGNHAYSLLSIHKIKNQTVLRLRNPWGYMVWKGAWSQESKQWTPQLRKQYKIQNNPNDGSFFINWKDFQKFYGTVNICKLNPMHVHSSLRMMNNKRKSNYITMKVANKGTYSIFICQQNPRKSQNKNNHQIYSNMRLILAKKHDNGDYEYIQAQSTQLNQLCIIDASLQKGNYLLSAKVFWKNENDRECVLSCYGSEGVTFEKIADRPAVAKKFKEDLVVSYSRAMKGSATVKTYDSYGFKNVLQELYLDLNRGIGFIKMINKSSKEFHNKKIFTMTGMKIIKPKTSPFEFNVLAGKEEVIGFFLSASGYSYSVSETFWQ